MKTISKFLFGALCALLMNSCSNCDCNLISPNSDDGGKYYNSETKTVFDGTCVSKYDDGKKQIEMKVKNGTLRLKTSWYRDGSIELESAYWENGARKSYKENFENGKQKFDITYNEEAKILTKKVWFENGQLKLDISSKVGLTLDVDRIAGLKEGDKFIEYFEDGKVKDSTFTKLLVLELRKTYKIFGVEYDNKGYIETLYFAEPYPSNIGFSLGRSFSNIKTKDIKEFIEKRDTY